MMIEWDLSDAVAIQIDRGETAVSVPDSDHLVVRFEPDIVSIVAELYRLQNREFRRV